MTKAVFVLANVLYRYFYPVYRFIYYIFKRKQDSFEIQLLKRFIKKDNIVLDIGANVGFYAEIISDLVGANGTVHAFEPDPINFKHLVSSCRNRKNIIANNLAVSNTTGELKLYTSNLLNVDHRTYPVDDFGKSFSVKAETIDNYVDGKKVDFIKMDIQGAEYFALCGMTKTLDANEDIVIITEFWPFGLKQSGNSVAQFQAFVKEKRFKCYIVNDNQLLETPDLMAYDAKPEKEYFNLILTRKAL